MGRPEGGLAAARLFRWQMAPITQVFGNELEAEPLSRKRGIELYPLEHDSGDVGHWHRGVDIALPMGTPIRLILSGMVRVPPFDPAGFGYSVQCDGARYRLTYGHLSVVRTATGVRGVHGDLIGLSGSTGNSTGPHVHFELFDKKTGSWVDPWLAV